VYLFLVYVSYKNKRPIPVAAMFNTLRAGDADLRF